MKLHLPVLLRKALLACFAFSLASGAAHAADLTLGGEDFLTIDYAEADSIPDLAGCTLQLQGDTNLLLSNCGSGDGKTYTLATGVSSLLDAEGNALTLNSSNNAVSLYFDTTQPGSGFWAGGTLQLVNGQLQLLLHDQSVKSPYTLTSRKTGGASYQYYRSFTAKDFEPSSDGGAISGSVTLKHNGRVEISGNTASSGSDDACGGAICGDYYNRTITLSNNGSVVFEGNTASGSSYAYGGAIYGFSFSPITLSNNGSVEFIGNTASGSDVACGGAIRGNGNSPITLSNNVSVVFEGNAASSTYSSAYGGAIDGYDGSTITLSNNGSVEFSGNTASSTGTYASGGAIYGSDITLSDNGSVTFSGNTASSDNDAQQDFAYGGAISGDRDSTITLSDNESVTFSGNTASSNDNARGGAISGDRDSTITLSDNGSVTFSGNTASASSGGAIYGDGGSTITLSNNGSVTFSGNTASSGGAIYGDRDSTITLSDNGSVTFSGNRARDGGAIYNTQGDLSIRNNDSVEFYQNAEVVDGNTYRLRSIYADGGSGDEISLSAAAGKSITFYDSVYIGSDATVNLNQDYTYQAENGSYVTIRQQGDIIFTGADTEQHLNDLLEAAGAGRTATAAEIRLSRTTEVNTLTELYGGRLRVEEGAIYQGQGITAMEGSAATVRVQNATLSHSGYDLTFNAGTSLELAGNNMIAGALQMLGGSSLVFDNTHGNGTTDLIGSLGFGSDVSLVLGNQAYGSNEVLLYVSDAVSGWDAAHLMVQGNSYTADSFTWVDNLLVLNYDESSFNRYFNGSANYNERHEDNVIRLHYESLAFTTETSSSQGGAIYGDGSAVILLSDNGSVSFSGNTASSSYSYAYGGAIYGSTITLSDNGSVTFSGNTASSTYSSASGGAISGNVTMTGNGDVRFSGNTASSSSSAYGGAIYTQGDLSIQNNDSVEFYQNAEVVNGNTYRLRSIYAYGGSGAEISLSAAAGKSITFRDSIYIGEGSSFKLNEQYEGQSQLGNIIFTGATTVDDLYTVKDNVAGTTEEIRLSRTTEVNTLTELYGGRLRVEEGAIYQGWGITAMEGSGATVRVQNATLSHEGYDLTFNAGTTLELVGDNTITGNVEMLEDSLLHIIRDMGGGVTSHRGELSVKGNVVVDVSSGNFDWTLGEQNVLLFETTDSDIEWNPTSVILTGAIIAPEGVRFAQGDTGWQGGEFCLNLFVTDTVVWDNAAGDSLWNNESANWSYGDYRFDDVQGMHVVLGAVGQGEMTLVGDIATRNLTVESGCFYELSFANDSNLTVHGELSIGADAGLMVHSGLSAAAVSGYGCLVVDGALTTTSLQAASLEADSLTLSSCDASNEVTGALRVKGKVQSAAALSVGGAMTAQQVSVVGALAAGSLQTDALEASALTLTDAAANNRIGSSVTLAGAVNSAGSLTVAGALTAGSLQAGALTTDSLTLTDAAAANTLSGNAFLSGAVSVAGALNVAGSLTAGSLQAGALTADSLTLTDATAANRVSGDATLNGAVNVAGTLQVGGNLTLGNGSSVTNHTITIGGAVTMSGSALTSTVISGATGNISISNSRLTTSGVETTSGNATITGTLATTPTAKEYANESEKSGGIKSFTTSLAKVGAGSSVITSVKVKERDGNGTQDTTTPLRMVIKDAAGNVIATSTNTVTLSNTKEYREFEFAPTLLDPAASYTFAFVDASTGAVKSVSLQLEDQRNNANVALGDVTALTDKYATSKLGALVQFGYLGSENQLLGATVTTGNGALNLRGTYVAAANGEDTVIKATGYSRIDYSVLAGGTNVQVANDSLRIEGSYLLGDVNLKASKEFDFKGDTVINIDGGEAHDASLRAGTNLWVDMVNAVANDTISIRNADVQVGNRIEMYGGSTMNLTNVYAMGEDGSISASDLGLVKTRNSNELRGTLNITGSIISAEAIWSNSVDNLDYAAEAGTAINRYFGNINVADSEVEVSGKALIENLSITTGSEVSILGGAYLDTTSIDGTSKLTTGGASKLDDVNIADGGTLRVTETGSGVTTLANLNAGTTGTVNVDVVNATLQTPEVNERVVLGLNGGTLLIKTVDAHGTALGASAAAEANPHVVLAGLNNADAAEVTQNSTIRMEGLNRFGSDETKNDGIASLTVKGAFDADKITINAYKLATDEGNTSGFIQVDGALTGDDNILNADAHILVKGVLTGSGNQLTAHNGNVTLNAANSSLAGSSNTISATGGNVNLTDDVIGSNNVITATAVTNAAGQTTGGSILSANKWASIVGDTNTLTADADILLESVGSQSETGNNNVLTAGDSITINGTGNGTGINGSGNTLAAGTRIASKNIKGDRNQLTADEITATIVDGTGNALTGTTVDITGELKGSANTIEGNEIHVGTVSGTGQEIISNGVDNAADIAIDIDTLSGTNAVIGVLNDGSLNIDSMTAQTGAGDTGSYITVLKGNVGIGTLNTTAENTINVGASYGITVGSGSASNQTWTAGSLAATGADGLTLTDSTVTISGAVESTAELNLAGDTALTATSVQAGTLRLDGADVMLSADSVVADEVVVDTPANNTAVFNELVANKVTVTSASSLPDNLSVGGGSVIGELVADKLEVREGTATLGSTAKQTEQELQSIELQKGGDLVLQGQTSLSVTDSVAMTAGSEVQIQSGASLQNGAVALSAAPGTAAAQLNSKTGTNLVEMQRDAQFSIHDMLLVNTSISAAEGNTVTISGVEGSENLHLLGGADFSLTFADNKADVGMAVIENSSPVTGITLSAGSTLTLVMDPSNNDFRDYSLVINMSGFEYEGGSLAATGSITDLNAAGIYLGGWLGELLADQGVVQESVGNLESPEVPGDSVPTVSYTYSTENNVGMIISIHGLSVPEPTTTTLSLLALCALAARRRRR